VTLRQLISYCGSAANVFTADYKKLIRIPGIGDKVARIILKKEGHALAEKEFERCNKQHIRIYFFTDPDYPARLKYLYDSPLVLYSRGDVNLNAERTVGVVGTRKVTDYGKLVVETLIRDLVPYRPVVISGLAYGVDIATHRACLKYQLPTVGVMASGINVIYPAVHKKTAAEMMTNGGIVTENSLDTQPDFNRFPARNRIIAGLSDVLVVIESARRGGSLITVEYAQNYHKDVFAVPGSLFSEHSEGCNQLIRDNKASIFTSVGDMVESINWNLDAGPKATLTGQTSVFEGITVEEGQVIAALRQQGEVLLDELGWQTGIHLGKLTAMLLHLEFKGIVKSMPGKKYSLC
jgi:DNA processing protein